MQKVGTNSFQEVLEAAETTSDIMTKNQQSVYSKSAQPKLVYTVEDMDEEETVRDK